MYEFCYCTVPKDNNLDYFDKCYNSRSNECQFNVQESPRSRFSFLHHTER